MQAITERTNRKICTSVMECVHYFSVFRHPLKKDEIRSFMSESISSEELQDHLDYLCAEKLLNHVNGYYFEAGENEDCIRKRSTEELNASLRYRKALRYARFISGFPFVRSVSFSGSLSKGLLDDDGDVDYFIITQPGRLWVCRTLLIGFKKLILLNSRNYFCVNYFIDEDHLEVPDRNRFVATEISTLKNVFGKTQHSEFNKANAWVNSFFPNAVLSDSEAQECRRGIVKQVSEWILSGSLGEKADIYFFRLTLRKWQRKFSHFNPEDFDLNMRSRREVSKHHPRGFQSTVSNALREKMTITERELDLRFQ